MVATRLPVNGPAALDVGVPLRVLPVKLIPAGSVLPPCRLVVGAGLPPEVSVTVYGAPTVAVPGTTPVSVGAVPTMMVMMPSELPEILVRR